jgi:hypothetical protein
MSAYARGEKGKKVRKEVSVPKRVWMRGYTKIWSGRPINPMIAVAIPTRDEGRPRPPPKRRNERWFSDGARGFGRKMKVSELKALVWKASRNWTPSVSSTLGVQIARKLGRLCVDGKWWRGRDGVEGRERLVTLSVR